MKEEGRREGKEKKLEDEEGRRETEGRRKTEEE